MRSTFLVSTVLAASCAGIASANLLVNPGFEVNSLASIGAVVGSFSPGVWGPENGAITGVNGGVTPFAGSRMLKMDDDGLSYTQTYQATNVTSYAASIDANLCIGGMAARFTTGPNLNGAIAAVSIQFFSAANFGSQIGTGYVGSLALDGSATTWQTIQCSGAIPAGTRWILSQVAYKDSTLYSSNGVAYSGYVDNANMDIRLVPAPGAIGLMSLAGFVASRRRRVG
ncbi:MAG: hypothetical protein K8R92_04945 [Planctomycetes bacterium]|nr:hypothetical protein [Planctomycetota bacterium]